jgi:hypothetical protein
MLLQLTPNTRVALDFMKEIFFLKGDILFDVTPLTQWPNIWDLRQYALSTLRSCLNPKYWVTWHGGVDIAWKKRYFRNKIGNSSQRKSVYDGWKFCPVQYDAWKHNFLKTVQKMFGATVRYFPIRPLVNFASLISDFKSPVKSADDHLG